MANSSVWLLPNSANLGCAVLRIIWQSVWSFLICHWPRILQILRYTECTLCAMVWHGRCCTNQGLEALSQKSLDAFLIMIWKFGNVLHFCIQKRGQQLQSCKERLRLVQRILRNVFVLTVCSTPIILQNIMVLWVIKFLNCSGTPLGVVIRLDRPMRAVCLISPWIASSISGTSYMMWWRDLFLQIVRQNLLFPSWPISWLSSSTVCLMQHSMTYWQPPAGCYDAFASSVGIRTQHIRCLLYNPVMGQSSCRVQALLASVVCRWIKYHGSTAFVASDVLDFTSYVWNNVAVQKLLDFLRISNSWIP